MPGVPPNALDMLKKFGRSLLKGRSKRNKQPLAPPTEEQPEQQQGESSTTPAPLAHVEPPVAPPAPETTVSAIEAPKQVAEVPVVSKEDTAPAAETTPPPPPPEPTPAPVAEAPKAEEAPKAIEPVLVAPEAPKTETEAPHAPEGAAAVVPAQVPATATA